MRYSSIEPLFKHFTTIQQTNQQTRPARATTSETAKNILLIVEPFAAAFLKK